MRQKYAFRGTNVVKSCVYLPFVYFAPCFRPPFGRLLRSVRIPCGKERGKAAEKEILRGALRRKWGVFRHFPPCFRQESSKCPGSLGHVLKNV